MDVGIVAQKGNRRAALLADDIRRRLREEDVSVRFDPATAEQLGEGAAAVDSFDASDLVVSIGGDGTFLFAARRADGTPVLGVNLGEVGFLNAVGPGDAVEAVLAEVEAFEEGRMAVREVPRLAARGDGWTGEPAMNEIVVQGPRRGRGGGVDLEVRVDGSVYTDGRADGVLVATPTGSTAYNLSESGPLVHPRVPGLIVNEMCAAEGMPPLVVPLDAEIAIEIRNAPTAVVVSDGRSTREVEPPAEIRVARADAPVRLAGPASDVFQALHKLD
jgi:NAD+ kinase